MAWLGTWAYRVPITIDPDVDILSGSHTQFPVSIFIDASCGSAAGTPSDMTAVFDELTTANRKKIAVTTSDGATQLYVEIQRWDSIGEVAVLNVSKSGWSMSALDRLYLYFDSSQPDNTSYVGDTGDAIAQNVWDANYITVNHLAGYPFDSLKSASGVYDPTDDGYNHFSEGTILYNTSESKFQMWKKQLDITPSPDELSLIYLYSADGETWTDGGDACGGSTTVECPEVFLNTYGRGLPLQAAIAYDGSEGTPATNETTAANNDTANDMTLLPALPVQNQDAYFFGGHSFPNSLTINVGTAGAGTWTITWAYWNGSAWTALSNVSDGTNGFTTSGTNDVTYDLPANYASGNVGGITSYWIRALVSSFTSISTQPKGTQAWANYDYWLYMTNYVAPPNRYTDDLDLYVSAEPTGFHLLQASVLSQGDPGDFDDTGICNTAIWDNGTTMYMLYEGYDGSSHFTSGKATSTDGRTWSKDADNPIYVDDVQTTHGWGGPWLTCVDSVFYASFHGGMFVRSSDMIDWYTYGSGPLFADSLPAWEGTHQYGYLEDPHLVEYNGDTYIYYNATSAGDNIVGLIKVNMSLAEVFAYVAKGFLCSTSSGGGDVLWRPDTPYYAMEVFATDDYWAGGGLRCVELNDVDDTFRVRLSQASIQSAVTIETYFKSAEAESRIQWLISSGESGVTVPQYNFALLGNGTLRWGFWDTGGTLRSVTTGVDISNNTSYYVAGTYDYSTTLEVFLDGVSNNDASITQTPKNIGNYTLGKQLADANAYQLNGWIGFIRISNTVRSDNWILTTNHSIKDTLLHFGSVEEQSAFVPKIMVM